MSLTVDETKLKKNEFTSDFIISQLVAGKLLFSFRFFVFFQMLSFKIFKKLKYFGEIRNLLKLKCKPVVKALLRFMSNYAINFIFALNLNESFLDAFSASSNLLFIFNFSTVSLDEIVEKNVFRFLHIDILDSSNFDATAS